MSAIAWLFPFLALVAFLSIEVSAEVEYKLLSELEAVGATDGFPVMFNISDSSGPLDNMCTRAELESDAGCTVTAANFDNEAMVTLEMTLPADLTVAPDVGAPSKLMIAFCYAPTVLAGRAWRNAKDPFERDGNCIQKSDPIDYVAGAFSQEMKLTSKAPNTYLSPRVFVKCEMQVDKKNQYCHVANVFMKNATTDSTMYFQTDSMQSRTTGLVIGVIISCIVGPALLFAFLIYERGIVARA